MSTVLNHLIRPARGGAAGVILVFAALLTIASYAGFAGLPLAVILLSWFFKYAYILFDHVVRGFDEPPTLDIQMVNPLNEQRPLAQVIIFAAIGVGWVLAARTLPWAIAVILAASIALLIPASVAVLGLEGNILKAVYPVALFRMMKGLGLLYVAILGLIAMYGAVLATLETLDLWLPVQLVTLMFALLSLFSALAGAVYERRHPLGLETWHSPERTADRERAVVLRQSENTVAEAYGLVRVGAHAKAWQVLQDWLASRDHSPDDYRWLGERAATWSDARYPNRLAEEHVEKLLTLKRSGEALDVTIRRLRQDATFRPKTAAATLQIAQLAARGGGASHVARVLVNDFEQRFAGDPRIPAANTLARYLGE